ncbi:methyltransferase domain-containing protein [Actinokineospora auranticolor]|uniref:Methyltransferase family protein n=1 Tax=Actinokineospora auranticolor TaxID=155976 RepID=A0A2S6GLN5_9PSEU|nr:methyltransferase domain-containing protein [Actinokineospora auranticolor]PPK66137.1 methyltransferase family protein [Actinokineospora auranticolor]
MRLFDDLVAEATAADTSGSDYSWLDGRAHEQRAPWAYTRILASRIGESDRVLDAQTGDGAVLAGALARSPRLLAATESRPELLLRAQRDLAKFDGAVVAAEDGTLPFRDDTFDLVVSRHPRIGSTDWSQIRRVLRPGGTYLAQHVGSGSGRELVEAILGPQRARGDFAEREAEAAESAGLEVLDLRKAGLPVTFDDIGAVVYLLRKIVWFVPDFAVAPYRDRLILLDKHIRAEGAFHTLAHRFLIEARKPG